ncbi:glycoside hydrolase family 2 protein [Bacillus kwashiorkori]|uniref:glycoside hydrolase family 2 protein n=1 Tax=Bacillus kwashiorkori TaxID=1522318 RepID=UPI0008F8ABFC|nr:glycoside hydrolase family 2 [Bacillus kwashiorkori]
MSEKNIQAECLKIGNLQPTFSLKIMDGKAIPFQNNLPYPSFEPQMRPVLSLAGTWRKKRFNADHDWTMSARDNSWVKETERESNGIPLLSYDDRNWDTHSIPLPENHLTGKEEVNGAETYENGVWYRRKFEVPLDWEGKIVFLKALAVSYIGDFWINGEYVGYHEGGYTPFSFDVTNFLRSGENVIVVRVDNPPWTSRVDIVPAQDNDFFNYTGIIHDLYLEATEGVYVARADIVSKNMNGDIEITAVLDNRSSIEKTVQLKATIYDTDYQTDNWLTEPSAFSIKKQKVEVCGLDDQTINLLPRETRVVSYHVKINNPKIWSIREPNLYVLGLDLVTQEATIDTFHTQFGIRNLKTDEAKIYLNGKPIFLAGVARHEEWRDFGRSATWDRIKSDFLKISSLSVNMVRTAHYPNHVYTFIMLDRLGLTSMSEIPLWQFDTVHYEAQEKRKISYQMWREMVFSRFNSPSIILWSTQNESTDVILRKKYNEQLVNELRSSYNDGRLITQSSAADQPGYWDESMEPLDVMGWTMYFGIFHGSTPYEGTRNFIEKAHEKWPDKPIINTEYGIWSNADDSFLNKQVEIYRDVQLALLEKATVLPQGIVNPNGYLAGMNYWTAFDWFVNHNKFYQTMGMLRMDRTTEKLLYYEFVKDHQRLMHKTNGIGVTDQLPTQRNLAFDSSSVSEGYVSLNLKQSADLSIYNYLIISLFDSTTSDGVNVKIISTNGNSVCYDTYKIEAGKAFDVYVPLWKLEQSIISETISVVIQYDLGRDLEIGAITCRE